ncbi:MAG: hypothetical protein NDI75_08255 [Candidatus Didemnitutus sp.]|jgi:Tfp pilus assembly protein PilV|nr:hypothetical protein [Candidatus Didemnitutus sp.]
MNRRTAHRAFTLVEVMIASLVLVFGIVSALAAMQQGMQALDRARHLARATQLMQTEMERLRLKNWDQLESLQAAGSQPVAVESAGGGPAGGFTCTRTITSPKAGMKEITLTTEWHGFDGRPHRALLVSRYARTGLHDYFTTNR